MPSLFLHSISAIHIWPPLESGIRQCAGWQFCTDSMSTNWKNLSFVGILGKEAGIRGSLAAVEQKLAFVAISCGVEGC